MGYSIIGEEYNRNPSSYNLLLKKSDEKKINSHHHHHDVKNFFREIATNHRLVPNSFLVRSFFFTLDFSIIRQTYLSPRKSLPISSRIFSTSHERKSVFPKWIACLNRNCSPNSPAARGAMSKMPENGKGCPPYAYSRPYLE